MGKKVLPGHTGAFQISSEPRQSGVEALVESHKFLTESYKLVPGQTDRITCLGKPTMFKSLIN